MKGYRSLLNSTVARYTQSISSNAWDEDSESWNYEESGIRCRLQPISAVQRKELPGEFEDVKYNAYFLSTQTITTEDEIHFGDNSYRVREVMDDSSGYVRKALLSQK